ncbi:RNA polymerase sigma factor [Actinomadura monticuli]|uniref:Sigma-70 family RNA polymerase sigma factor n=1 Tax=Actinomadura monticuli TaxID=3097367 RepID=A0ABV4Q708_9ACTN
MSGWPSFDRADDERLARSLAANDPSALIQVMDRYAARLYDYCHALLRDQEQAAGALHDALIAAYAHVPVLREPDRFRGWLYALVRNECMRRLRDPGRPAERREAPEVEDGFLDEAELARRQDARRLVHSALSALRGRERESLDLMVRHGLDASEVGGVLGLDDQEAAELTGVAHARLDDAIAAVYIARTARGDCPELAAIAGGDGGGGRPLPPPVVRRLAHHVDVCPICGPRRNQAVPTARLLQVLPVAMIPTDLRGHVMATATDAALAPDMARIAHRAGPLDEWGWPYVVDRTSSEGASSERRTPRALWPALAAAAAVVVVVAGAFYVMSGSSGGTSAQGPSGAASESVLDPSSPPESELPSDSPTPTESESPTPTPTTSTPTPTPTRTRRPSSQSSEPRPTYTRPRTGVLLVGGGCHLTPGQSCAIQVRAAGGTVNWSASAAAPLSTGGGGRLAEGRTATATVTLSGDCEGSGSGTVSFSPNGGASVSWTCPPGGGGPGGGG